MCALLFENPGIRPCCSGLRPRFAPDHPQWSELYSGSGERNTYAMYLVHATFYIKSKLKCTILFEIALTYPIHISWEIYDTHVFSKSQIPQFTTYYILYAHKNYAAEYSQNRKRSQLMLKLHPVGAQLYPSPAGGGGPVHGPTPPGRRVDKSAPRVQTSGLARPLRPSEKSR